MNFVKLFGNKIRAKDVVFKNEKTLDDTKSWENIKRHVGGFTTITVDLSKYDEFLLTIGTYPTNSWRILSSTLIPKISLQNVITTDDNGIFQTYYNGTYWAGIDYLGNNQIRIRSSNTGAVATLWGR